MSPARTEGRPPDDEPENCSDETDEENNEIAHVCIVTLTNSIGRLVWTHVSDPAPRAVTLIDC